MAVYLNDNYHAAELIIEESPYDHTIVAPEEGMDANYAEMDGGYIHFELERTMPTGMIALDDEARSLLDVDVGDQKTVLFLQEHPILD